MKSTERRGYDESFAHFVRTAGGDGAPRPIVVARPAHDDASPGPSLFRQRVADCALTGLTLPGLFVGRSGLTNVAFSGSDLRLSVLSWSDYQQCWFDACDLRDSDLRASLYVECDFSDANLTRCDLRHATFRDCDFARATLHGAVAARSQRAALALTDDQAASVDWRDDAGPEPAGG